MEQALPRGYHFTPTEEELVDILADFLQEKPLQSIPVVEKVVYGEDATPWHIFFEDDLWQPAEGDAGTNGAKKIIYVFTKLSSMSAKKKSRTAGCGTWNGQTGSTDIKNSKGQIIGVKKMLSFGAKGDTQKENGHWIMHEYALAGESLKNVASPNDYVICKITRDHSKFSKGKKFEKPQNYPVLGKRKAEAIAEAKSSENSNIIKQCSDSDVETSIAVEALMELPKTQPYVAEYQRQIKDEIWACSNYANPIAAAEGLIGFLPNNAKYEGQIPDSHPAKPLETQGLIEFLPNNAKYEGQITDSHPSKPLAAEGFTTDYEVICAQNCEGPAKTLAAEGFTSDYEENSMALKKDCFPGSL